MSQTIDKLRDYDFLRAIITNLPAVAFVVAPDGTVLFAEGKGLAVAGLTRDEFLGAHASEFFHLYPELEGTLHRVLEGETITSRAIAPSQRSFEVTYSPMRDDRGSICGVIGVAQDITERVEQEQTLRDSEEKFRRITSAAIDAIIMMDETGRISLWNEAAQAVFGYTEQEAIGEDLHLLVAPQRYLGQAFIDSFAARGDSPPLRKTVELRGRRKSGEEFPMELSLTTFRLQDRRYAVGTARDITERKLAEERMQRSESLHRALIETTGTGYVIIDDQGVLLDANPEYVRLTGRLGLEEIRGKRVVDWTADHDKEKNARAVEECSKGGFIRNLEIDYVDSKGNIIPVEINATLIETGGTPTILSMCRDITERRRAEKALQLQSRLQELLMNMSNRYLNLPLDAIESAIHVSLGEMGEFVEADRVFVLDYDFNKQVAVMTNEWCREGTERQMADSQGIPLASIPALNLDMHRRGEMVWLSDANALPSSAFRDTLERNCVRSQLTVPCMNLGECLGFVGFSWSKQQHSFSVNEQHLLTVFANMLVDIRRRKQADEALRESQEVLQAVLNSIPVRVFWKDRDSKYLGCNMPFARDAGFEKPDDIIGKDDSAMGWREQAELYRADDRGVIESGNAKLYIEEPQTTPSGEQIHLLTSKVPLRDVGGAIVGVLGTYQDITERRRAEQALRESENTYRAIFENTGSATVIIEEDTVISLANSEFERLSGWDRREVEGKMSWTHFVVPEDLDMMVTRHHLRREDPDAAPTTYEFRMHDKSGAIKHILLNVVIIAGTAKSVASLTDITERKRFEEALCTSENAYRAIFENTGTATMIVEEDTTISLVNSEFEKLTGYTKAEIEGRKRWTEFVVEKDVDRMLNQHLLRRTDPRAALRSYEFRLRGKDGAIRDVLMTVDIIPSTKQSLASCLDITERKRAEEALRESEEKFRRIFEEGPVGMAMAGKDRRFIRANAALCRMLGYSASELTSLTFRDITHPDHLSVDSEFVKQVFRGEIPRYRTEKRYVRKDNETVWGALTLSTIRSNNGQFLYFLAMVEDITERKRVQEEKERLQQQLQQSQKLEAIGTMASGIAHDFNNILTGILGFTELVRSDVSEGSEIHNNLTEVLLAGRRARDLVRQILYFSRKAEAEKSQISLMTIVKEGLKLIRSVVPSHIAIRQNFTASAERSIFADPTQMHQIVMNLCLNAADAMPDGGVLEITLDEEQLTAEPKTEKSQLPPGPYLKLTVRDNGIGMSPEVQERIFEPYYTTKQVGKGTGMGLAVVHGVVKEHGGSITVASEPGKGTIFIVHLPIVEAAPDTDVIPAPVIVHGTESILVVDDEAIIINVQRSQLERWGYRVTAAESSNKALNLFRANPQNFDLVITDQTMPGMTGIKLVQAIHEISPSTPIILSTGMNVGMSLESAQVIGINAILPKPTTAAELNHAVRTALDGTRKSSFATS